jgi:hypothetical protein
VKQLLSTARDADAQSSQGLARTDHKTLLTVRNLPALLPCCSGLQVKQLLSTARDADALVTVLPALLPISSAAGEAAAVHCA